MLRGWYGLVSIGDQVTTGVIKSAEASILEYPLLILPIFKKKTLTLMTLNQGVILGMTSQQILNMFRKRSRREVLWTGSYFVMVINLQRSIV